MTEQTKKIIDITRPDDRQTDELVCLWQASVRATHHFLSERDILTLESEVRSALVQIPELYAFSERGKILGFIGLADGKAEMLFVSPDCFGRGIGSELLTFAGIGTVLMNTILQEAKESGARMVVLETQTCNENAIAFYRKHGFAVDGRSPLDDQGNPFPILHLKLGR